MDTEHIEGDSRRILVEILFTCQRISRVTKRRFLARNARLTGQDCPQVHQEVIFGRNQRFESALRLAMKFKSPLLGLLVLLLISFSVTLLITLPVAAQTDEQEKVQKELERRQELERKTLALLDEVATQTLSLKLPENRSFVLTAAADLLWTHDENRARNLFWDALNNLTSPTNPASNDSMPKDSTTKGSTTNDSTTKRPASDKVQSLSQYYAMFGVRQEFLRKVARRDPQLALDMLRATRLPPTEPVNANYHLPDERDLEQEIANEAAVRDPKRALQIARESLAKGLTFQLLGVLSQLNRRNPEAAQEFAGDLIDKIHSVNLATDPVAWRTAIELLRLARTPQDVPAESGAVLGPGRLKLNDDQKRELVEILTDAALSASANANLLSGLSEVMPEVEQFAPDRVAKIKTKLAETNRILSPEQRQWNDLNSLVSKGTPEELIRAAAKSSDDVRREIYQAAVMKAVMKGKADALREFIKSEVEDASQRNSLNDLLDAQEIGWAVNHGNTEELQKLLPSIRLKEKRAEAMAEIAMMLEKKGEHDEALKLLDDARTLVKVDLKSQTQSDALLAVMLAYALVDPAKAFAIIEPIIDHTNDDISKLLLLDRIVKSGAVKNGEIIMQQPGIVSIDFAIFKYGKGVVALANADFDRTKAAADRFQRNELRIMARLTIAQALLRSTEQVGTKNAP